MIHLTANRGITCRPAVQADIGLIIARFAEQGVNKPREIWERYLREQESGERFVIIAEINGEIAGYVTLFPKVKDAVPYLESGMPDFEMAEVREFATIPDKMRFPQILPVLYKEMDFILHTAFR